MKLVAQSAGQWADWACRPNACFRRNGVCDDGQHRRRSTRRRDAAVVNADAYPFRFKTNGNPNLDCLRELRISGVEVSDCGQSLIGEGEKPSEVAEQADVAVSALTALVNLQSDGYTYLPMLK